MFNVVETAMAEKIYIFTSKIQYLIRKPIFFRKFIALSKWQSSALRRVSIFFCKKAAMSLNPTSTDLI